MIGRHGSTSLEAQTDGFAVNEKEHLIYVLEFKRMSDIGETYVADTQRMADLQHLAVTQAQPLESGLRAHR